MPAGLLAATGFRGFAATGLLGLTTTCLYDFAAICLYGLAATGLCGLPATRICGLAATRIFGLAATPAWAATALIAPQTIRLEGQVGFVGEWALRATLDRAPASPADDAFSGPLTMRHVGLCSHAGPEEVAGRATAVSLGATRVTGLALTYGAESCVYSGPLTRGAGAFMRCKNGTEVPIRIWTTP
jgi:hypothetical protein